MDFGLFLTCLLLFTLIDDIALEKTQSTRKNIDKVNPFILKPALITDNKVVNKDYSLKPSTKLPTGDDNTSKASKTIQDSSDHKKPKKQEIEKNYETWYHEYDPDCPECNNKDNVETKENSHATPEFNDEQKPIQEIRDNARKVIEMKLEKPYIIHNDHVTREKIKTSDKPEIVKPKDVLGAVVNPNRNVESRNDTEIEMVPNGSRVKAPNTVSVNRAPVVVAPSPNRNVVKIENDYHMKEYKELYAPYYSYSSNYPYNENYCYNFNQNGYNYNQHNGYNYHNNGYRYHINNGYSYNQNNFGYQKPLSKVWRTVSYTTTKNGDVASQQYSTYNPVTENNCYNPGSEQIGGYAYYFN